MASIMASRDVTISHNDDEILVSLSNSNILNGLDLASPSSEQSSFTNSPAAPDVSGGNARNSKQSAGRFHVQPASTDSSILYKIQTAPANVNDSNIPKDNGGIATVTVGSVSSVVSPVIHSHNVDDHLQSAINDLPDPTSKEYSTRKKRVSFPEGQALIKGFAHAPNPWYNG